MDEQARLSLLLEIARCSEMRQCVEGSGHGSPCLTVVGCQATASLDAHQMAEPWSGHLDKAPILFVSSNPTIGNEEMYPLWECEDETVVSYFERRFELFIRDGKYALRWDEEYEQAQKFWAGVLSMATEILGRAAVGGVDYALTEVVHCKSRSERGVPEALDTCLNRYMKRVLDASIAPLLVILGKSAGAAMRAFCNIDGSQPLSAPSSIAGRTRRCLFLGHPTGSEIRRPSVVLGQQGLADLRVWLGSAVPRTDGSTVAS